MIAKSVLKSFTENFFTQPKLYFSPGRINLIGEHLDYNDGFVMPAAYQLRGCTYAISENNSPDIYFYALDFHERYSVNLGDIHKTDGWRNYVLSVVNEFVLLGKEAGWI
jgi:galactokinase